MSATLILGLDLGKIQDYSALVGMQRAPTDRVIVQHIERLPAGLPYHDVVARVATVARALVPPPTPHDRMLQQMAGVRVPAKVALHLAIDATGVGEPVVEMLYRADLPATLWPIVLTGSGRAHFDEASRRWHVPKADVLEDIEIRGAAVPQRLVIPPSLPLATALAEELGAIRTTLKTSGQVQYEYDRSGTSDRRSHGDLAIALALACWVATRGASVGEIRWM